MSNPDDVSMHIAMPAVWLMQVSGDQVVGVIAVGDHFMTTAGPMAVLGIVRTAGVLRRALAWVGAVDRDAAFDDTRSLRLVQMSVVEIIHVVLMPNGGVTAIRAVRMRMLVVNLSHLGPPHL